MSSKAPAIISYRTAYIAETVDFLDVYSMYIKYTIFIIIILYYMALHCFKISWVVFHEPRQRCSLGFSMFSLSLSLTLLFRARSTKEMGGKMWLGLLCVYLMLM